MIENYKIITKSTLDELRREVSGAVIEGWRPQGGIAVLRYEANRPIRVEGGVAHGAPVWVNSRIIAYEYFQAMVQISQMKSKILIWPG